jgi:hypothetical protein
MSDQLSSYESRDASMDTARGAPLVVLLAMMVFAAVANDLISSDIWLVDRVPTLIWIFPVTGMAALQLWSRALWRTVWRERPERRRTAERTATGITIGAMFLSLGAGWLPNAVWILGLAVQLVTLAVIAPITLRRYPTYPGPWWE